MSREYIDRVIEGWIAAIEHEAALRMWEPPMGSYGRPSRPHIPEALKSEVISLLEILQAETISSAIHRRTIAAIEKIKEIPHV